MTTSLLGDTGGSINNAGVLPVYPKNGDRGRYTNVNSVFMNETFRGRNTFIPFRKIVSTYFAILFAVCVSILTNPIYTRVYGSEKWLYPN